MRGEAGGVQTDELPEGAPRQGGSRGGRGPISCAPAALPSRLPRETKELLLPPKHGQQDVRTHSAARGSTDGAPQGADGRGERRVPQPGAARNWPQAMPAPTLACVYLHPDQEYVHPHPGLAGCASTAPNAAAGYMQAPAASGPLGVLWNCRLPTCTTDCHVHLLITTGKQFPDRLPRQPGGRETATCTARCSGEEPPSAQGHPQTVYDKAHSQAQARRRRRTQNTHGSLGAVLLCLTFLEGTAESAFVWVCSLPRPLVS